MNPFKGEMIRLAPLDRESIPTYLSWFRDYDIQQWMKAAVPVTVEAETAWYEETTASENAFSFEIRTLQDDHLIGNCSIFGIDHKNRSGELGIVIGEKAYWGKGWGSDAVQTLLRFAFGEINLNRVYLRVLAHNKRAIRAYEKCGFQHEGTARQALFREGQYHDMNLMAILFEDWQRQVAPRA
jgi:RimJ/RimL family protein N-acetyltransferase